MTNNIISYRESSKRLYFSPFPHVHSQDTRLGYPWHLIGNVEIDNENGYAYITPVYGRAKLQLDLHTYSTLIYKGAPLFDLFNASCNYKLIAAEVKMVYPNYSELNLFKPDFFDNVDSFTSHKKIIEHYNCENALYAMFCVGDNTYNVFTFEEVDNA